MFLAKGCLPTSRFFRARVSAQKFTSFEVLFKYYFKARKEVYYVPEIYKINIELFRYKN